MLDYWHKREVLPTTLEVRDGRTVPAMHPEWFYRTYDQWDWWDRELLSMVEAGPVLDLGCGAGRAALYLQHRGFEVTALDSSPGAVEVCRLQDLQDVRLGDMNDPPRDRRWAAVLLLCGNLGLGGSWDGNRQLLKRLAELSVDGAVLVGDSVNTGGAEEIALRIRYGDALTPWWSQRNVSAAEIPPLIDGTGWEIERQLEDGDDHAVLLRRLPR